MSIQLLSVVAGQAPPIRLHLGCGGVRLAGYINVDLYPHDPKLKDDSRNGCQADVFADIRKLGLADDTVDEIVSVHTLEHFTRWETKDMVADFHRCLRPGGRLVVEMPDFVRCVLWLLHPARRRRQAARNQFYGNQWDRLDYETHRYLWSAGEFKRLLVASGFARVRVHHGTEAHYPGRDFRAEAVK
jgi:SAM-dependent methyltransferase